jgi:hypothetical protein
VEGVWNDSPPAQRAWSLNGMRTTTSQQADKGISRERTRTNLLAGVDSVNQSGPPRCLAFELLGGWGVVGLGAAGVGVPCMCNVVGGVSGAGQEGGWLLLKCLLVCFFYHVRCRGELPTTWL